MPKKTKAIKVSNKKDPWAKRRLDQKPYSKFILPQKSFLIICEGENTEPQYFKSFPLGNANVVSFGIGKSKTSLIEHIIGAHNPLEQKQLQEVWAVFDFDINPEQLQHQKIDFERAIDLAENNNIKTAWSNDCFELWFVQHFQLIQSRLTRTELYKILSQKWNCNYTKVGKQFEFCRSIYKKLIANQSGAIKNSKTLERINSDVSFSQKNPGTSVHYLVEELNKYL